MIKEFNVTNIKEFSTSTSSKGNQNKWHYDCYWIKEDYLGYEGLSEVLCSRIAKSISFPYNVAEYYPCIINHESTKTIGCYSCDFSEGMSVITLHRLFEILFPDVDLYEILNERITPLERIKKVLSYLTPIINNFDLLGYLTSILEFDALIYNEDRHCNNIIFLYNGKCFHPAPLFDCGAGLLSDLTSDYPINKSIDICIREVKNNAKPFSRSFKK